VTTKKQVALNQKKPTLILAPTILMKLIKKEEILNHINILHTTRVWRIGGLRLNLKFRLSIPKKANCIDFFS